MSIVKQAEDTSLVKNYWKGRQEQLAMEMNGKELTS